MKSSIKTIASIVAALFVFALFPQIADSAQPQTTVKQWDTEPFRDWTDRSKISMPKIIEIRVGNYCNAGGTACVNWNTGVMSFPNTYLNNPAFNDARPAFYHESGHIFQIQNNNKVQTGYPLFDTRCEGTFTQTCAEFFAIRFDQCARELASRDILTCGFIESVALP
jgi:hypothetical protein